MHLNLGACDRRIEGYVSVDICPPADQIADLSQPWPWLDSSVDAVVAFDVFEHLPNKRHTMNELWRVLKHGGIAKIQVPHATDGDGGHCDPTHCSYWTTSDFEYYAIKADFKVVNIQTTRHSRRFGGYVIEIQAQLEAVK